MLGFERSVKAMDDQINHVVDEPSVLVGILLTCHRLGDHEVQITVFCMPEDDAVGILVFAEHRLEFEDRIGQARKRKGDVLEDRCFAPCSHGGHCRIHPFAELPKVGLFLFVLRESDRAQGL